MPGVPHPAPPGRARRGWRCPAAHVLGLVRRESGEDGFQLRAGWSLTSDCHDWLLSCSAVGAEARPRSYCVRFCASAYSPTSSASEPCAYRRFPNGDVNEDIQGVTGQLELFDAGELRQAKSPQPFAVTACTGRSGLCASTADTPAMASGQRHEIRREREMGGPVVVGPEMKGQPDRGDAEEAWPIADQVLSFRQRVIAAGERGEVHAGLSVGGDLGGELGQVVRRAPSLPHTKAVGSRG